MWRKSEIAAVLAAALAAVVACTHPERFRADDVDPGGEMNGGKVSVAHLKTFYGGYPYTFTEPLVIEGRVESTDRSGNYPHTLAVSDSTGGIEIRIDDDRLFERFGMGARVEVQCNGLTIGDYGGVLQLGDAPDGEYEVGMIDAGRIGTLLRVTAEADGEFVPLPRTIAALSAGDVSRLVSVRDVQFVEAPGTTWCESDGGDFVATDRFVEDRDGNRLAVRTLPGAECAGWVLPEGSGSIEGILSSFNGVLQLRVVRPQRLYYTMSGERF